MFRQCSLLSAAAFTFTTTTASAGVLIGGPVFGTSASTVFGERSGGVTTVGSTDTQTNGGSEILAASSDRTGLRGSAAAQAIIGANPIVRGRSLSASTDDVARGNAAINGAYLYDGPAAGTVSFDYSFTATFEALAGADTFIRAEGALLSDVTNLSFSRASYFEFGGQIEDDFRIEFREDDPSPVSTTGTLTIDVTPGEIFNVLLSLQTSAGGAGANADAFNTLTGTFSTSVAGASVTAVPEPASLALLGMGSLLLVRRRRVA